MNRGFIHRLGKLWAGQSLARMYMNESFLAHTLRGTVVDVGGGRNPDYFNYFEHKGVCSITPVDQSLRSIDFEKDVLPFTTASIDTAVCANVLEHIYNYRFLVGEMRRILRPGGTLIGFVPFLIQYHPDPHDYFRYTKESLARIFAEAGFEDVKVQAVGGGPFAVNFNNIVLSVPRPLRPILYVPYALVDRLFVALKPRARERYALGFVFTAKAHVVE